ncbi:rRNA accumulation- protein, partial [Massospora cicadina]
MAHPNQILFTEAVSHIFMLWPALNLAVQNEWGGPESKEKRDWMKQVIIEEFGN